MGDPSESERYRLDELRWMIAVADGRAPSPAERKRLADLRDGAAGLPPALLDDLAALGRALLRESKGN